MNERRQKRLAELKIYLPKAYPLGLSTTKLAKQLKVSPPTVLGNIRYLRSDGIAISELFSQRYSILPEE